MVIDLAGIVEIAKYYILLMSVVVLAGGILGFVKAKSKASLISGGISAVFLAIAFVVSLNNKLTESLIAAFLIYTLLDCVFVMRLVKTKKMMPAVPILVMCVIGQALSVLALSQVTGTK